MRSEILNSTGLQHQVKITIPYKTFQDMVDERLHALTTQVKIAGFRPGKVPLQIIKQRYYDSVKGEILEKLLQDSIHQTLHKHEFQPAQQPKVSNIFFEEEQDIAFELEIEVLPEIPHINVEKLSLQKHVITVSDETINTALARYLENKADFTAANADYKAQHNDFIGVERDFLIDNVIVSKDKHQFFLLGHSRTIPIFDEVFLHSKIGEEKTFEVTLPESYKETDLAGKTVTCRAKVEKIEQRIIPELTEEFAQQEGAKDIAELKSWIKADLEREYNTQSNILLKKKLFDQLETFCEFPVPESMLKHEFETIWAQFEEDRKNNQLDPEDENKSEEELKTHYQAIALRRIRLGLLFSDFAKKLNVYVTDTELNMAAEQEANRYPSIREKVLQYFKQNPQAKNRFHGPLLEEKIFNALLKKIEVEEVNLSEEAFTALAEEQSAPQAAAKKATKTATNKEAKATASKATKAISAATDSTTTAKKTKTATAKSKTK